MGQTLTHGVYLPDKGERNCYSGLAANWQILDRSVGTVTEHTSALSGKAPLVHTHSKADITDFPVYGTTAGTICEGNDSRLSDARTPVAHTHTKSDVTDLFNSANTWTADNTFSGINSFSKHQIFQAGAYFYNSDSTAATSGLNLRNSKVTKGGTSDSGSQIIQFLDKDNKFLSQVTTAKALSGTTQLQFNLGNIDSNNNAITGGITFSLAIDGTKQFIPGSDSTHNLGNSSYKWKTLNGINPGALSLPDCQVTQSIDRTGWVYDGATYNTVLLATTDTNMTKNGWLYVRMANTTSSDKLTIKYNSTADRFPTNTFGDVGGYIEAFVPVVADTNIYVLATKDLSFCKFYPCLGNIPSGV